MDDSLDMLRNEPQAIKMCLDRFGCKFDEK